MCARTNHYKFGIIYYNRMFVYTVPIYIMCQELKMLELSANCRRMSDTLGTPDQEVIFGESDTIRLDCVQSYVDWYISKDVTFQCSTPSG